MQRARPLGDPRGCDDCAGVCFLRDCFRIFRSASPRCTSSSARPCLLIFGAAPAAFGLALGLLLQGMFFVPSDLPQYGMNVTTLLVPLFAIGALADRVRICGALKAYGRNLVFLNPLTSGVSSSGEYPIPRYGLDTGPVALPVPQNGPRRRHHEKRNRFSSVQRMGQIASNVHFTKPASRNGMTG